jgi:hypothetical protein
MPGQLTLIMTMGLLPDAMEPGIHCVRSHWIRGFMAFQLVRRIRTVRLMVPMCPESGFLGRTAPAGGGLARDQQSAAALAAAAR